MAFSLANMPKWFSLNVMMDFIFSNIMWIAGIGIIAYIVLTYLRVGTRTKIKPVNRSEVERLMFIERMKHNTTSIYKWLKHDTKILGKIMAFRRVTLPATNPSPEHQVLQMLVKPTLSSKLPLVNPLAKTQAFQLDAKHIDIDTGGKSLIMPRWLALDYYFGVYYDLTNEGDHTKLIKQDNLLRSDLNQLASIYYAKSQEQSTFDPDKAHALALKEKELQIEMAKKRGKITTI